MPAGFKRDQLTVRMSYYVESGGQRSAKISLLGPNNQVLAKATGGQEGSEPRMRKVQPPGFPPHYPMYEVITVDGVTDVIEHRAMEPIFYITDDPAIWAEFRVKR
jgi:hypothetical protein